MRSDKRMRTCLLLPACTLLALLGHGDPVLAEKADRAKPINLLAAMLVSDDAKGESVASGGVLITKGSILIRAEKAVLREDAQGYQHAWLSALPGQRVFFRQKREGAGDEFIEAEAQAIHYDGRADVVNLAGRGELRHYRGAQLAGELLGERIRYDDARGRFAAEGGAPASAASAPSAPARPPVRLMLVPREP